MFFSDTGVLARATTDVQSAFGDQNTFEASWVFVATWDEVEDYEYQYYLYTDTAVTVNILTIIL